MRSVPNHASISVLIKHLSNNLANTLPASWLRGSLLRKAAAACLLTLTLTGCLSRSASETTQSAGNNENTTVASELVNEETNVRILVPADWELVRGDRRQTADIYASYPPRGLYATVLSENAAGLDIFTLEDNSEQYRWLIKQELDQFEGESRTTLSSIDNKRAIQYEIRGVVDNTPVVYLHTTVEGSQNYYQVVGWTTETSYPETRETLQQIIQSFKAT